MDAILEAWNHPRTDADGPAAKDLELSRVLREAFTAPGQGSLYDTMRELQRHGPRHRDPPAGLPEHLRPPVQWCRSND